MRLLAWVDGGARGNPGPAGWGLFLKDAEGRPLLRAWGYLGDTTNNVAEYCGLIAALEEAVSRGATELEVRTDSELIQRQVTGVYRVRQPHLVPLATAVRELVARLCAFRILHVRREENRDADALANRAMDERKSGREEGAA
jgi:ribonuclease HI